MTREQMSKLQPGDSVAVDHAGWIKAKVVKITMVPMVTVMLKDGWSRKPKPFDIYYPDDLKTIKEYQEESDAYCKFMGAIPRSGTVPYCKDREHKWHETPPYGKICINCGLTDTGD